MSFFEPPAGWTPPPDPFLAEPEPTGRWLGGVVPVTGMIGRSDQAAVALCGVEAFPDGFAFTLKAWLRRRATGSGPQRMPLVHTYGMRGGDDNVVLHIGVEFPDGGRATDLSFDEPTGEHALRGLFSLGRIGGRRPVGAVSTGPGPSRRRAR